MATAKQSVIVRKSHPTGKTRSGAESVARKYADRIYTSRETATSWRFRQRPPSCFVDGSMRTKCLNKHVCVVFGRLKRRAKGKRRC